MYSGPQDSPGWEGENGLLPISMRKKSMRGQSAVTPPCRGSRREAATCGTVKRRGIRDVEGKQNVACYILSACSNPSVTASLCSAAPTAAINGNIVARSPLGRNSCLRRGSIGIPGLKLQLSKLYSHTSKGHATGVPLTVQIFICKLFAISVNFE